MMITELIFLGIGLLLGAISAWFIAKYKFAAASGSLPLDVVKQQYVLREVFVNLQEQTDMYRADMMEKETEIRNFTKSLSSQQQENLSLRDKLAKDQEQITQLQAQFQREFEHTANRIFEEKNQRFSQQNQEQLNSILNPLRDRIREFELGIERRYIEKTKDMVSLKKEIEQLRDLNVQLSEDANNLASALKGDNKTQGDWGEHQLELLLEKSGLVKGIHFTTQASYVDIHGKTKRPDFIINLPEGKHLVIDSKVSLVAYEKYCSASNKDKHLKDHIDSLRRHINDLSSKNYQHLYQISSPDYLLLFVPIEPAFALAVQNDQQLFLDALDKNIVMVSNSTLLATMRTVSYIWKQEKQKRSVLEIARQSGLLYDKLCSFVEDLQQVGHRIDQTQNAYHGAMNKLMDSKKYGDTLLGRAEKIRKLGAKNTKRLPKDLLE